MCCAQVYKGRTQQGIPVAVKVRRPGVVRQVALDNHCFRLLLMSLKAYGVLSEQTDILSIIEEVASGLFRELDLRQEAENAESFAQVHSGDRYLRVPRHIKSLTATRVLTQEWIDGSKIGELQASEQVSCPVHGGRKRRLPSPSRRSTMCRLGLSGRRFKEPLPIFALETLMSRDWGQK